MLEVCVDSLESAINAIHGGADELEVCSSLVEGGLTPSAGLVKQIREMKPKLNVMIRCRTGSDFHYTEEEMDTMLSDIDVFQEIGVDRYVFGALTASQEIDEFNCSRMLQKVHPIPMTFHRAFDICINPNKAIGKIEKLGFSRLLTSGQKSSVNDTEAVELIKSLNKNYGHKIQIVPGAGINVNNAKMFIDLGCEIVHGSCKRIKQLPELKNMLTMGTGDSEYLWVTDENIVMQMKEILLVKK